MYYDIVMFHVKYELTYKGPPRKLPEDLSEFRIKFMQEELDEYKKAVASGNLHEQFDALIDLVYVALGTAYMHGFNFPEGWRRVHEANMRKVRVLKADDSKRGSTYDVIKPPGWAPASLYDLLDSRQQVTDFVKSE